MDRRPLRRVDFAGVPEARLRATDPEAETVAARIIEELRAEGEPALRRHAEAFGEIEPGAELFLDRTELLRALDAVDAPTRALLERSRDRIAAFAEAQRRCLLDLEFPVPGGLAGHRFVPVAGAGCYVPGGRFPLASSALMTAVPARVAGVGSVWCAGPRPGSATLAAAALAGADGFLLAGGAHAIAALAFGCGPVAGREVVVGPGGRFVAAAKRLLFGTIGTEAPAGPSELLIIATNEAEPALMAADLIAQAEHDPAASPALVVFGPSAEAMVLAVEAELERQLAILPEPNAGIARKALAAGGWAFVARDEAEAIAAADRFAPEHLELFVEDAAAWEGRVGNAGAVFVGARSAEVLGDYGTGPNHCLPTGGASRFAAGLSVLAFLRARTWLRMEDPRSVAIDAAAFARLEGLEGHARAAEARLRR
jgi:phosphoribosyl-ATP pyrophosphohydrolase/phosphoribosyl-AMP cyclohydrolase/histidinol dehydrogenase